MSNAGLATTRLKSSNMRLSEIIVHAQSGVILQKLDSPIHVGGKQYTYVDGLRHQGLYLTPAEPVTGTGYHVEFAGPLTHLLYLSGEDDVTDDYMKVAPAKLHLKKLAAQGKATLYQLSQPVHAHDVTAFESSFNELPSETLDRMNEKFEQEDAQSREKEQQKKQKKEHELEEVRKLHPGAAVLFTPSYGIGGFTWVQRSAPVGIFVKLKNQDTAWVWMRPPDKARSNLYPVALENLSVGPKEKADPKLAAKLAERFKV